MRLNKTTCTSTLSALALATLPGDRELFQPTPFHEDFLSGSGYVRRIVDGETCHAIDWDGVPGVESIFREKGRRSELIWAEFRGWRRSHPESGLTEVGDKACQLLLKYFGPYHLKTAATLLARRMVAQEREQLLKNLDQEYPPSLRSAAREYLKPHIAMSSYSAPFPAAISNLSLNLGEVSASQGNAEVDFGREPLGSLSEAEQVLRRYIVSSGRYSALAFTEDVARDVLKSIQPIEDRLEILDITEGLIRLPPIPGEGTPTDIDHIHFGALICRHRAVVVAALLADAGFEVEVVHGSVTQEGRRGPHLFVYAPHEGILEPSADGPNYWRRVVSSSTEDGKLALKVKGDSTYRLEHRTPLAKL